LDHLPARKPKSSVSHDDIDSRGFAQLAEKGGPRACFKHAIARFREQLVQQVAQRVVPFDQKHDGCVDGGLLYCCSLEPHRRISGAWGNVEIRRDSTTVKPWKP